jgi:hypothetical protein
MSSSRARQEEIIIAHNGKHELRRAVHVTVRANIDEPVREQPDGVLFFV